MNQRIQKYLSTKWPTIIWSAIVFVLLAMPGSGLFNETWFNQMQIDKLVHAFLFFVLTWLWIKYINQGKPVTFTITFMLAFVTTLYGITMEFIQIYTGRDFSVGDMVADGAGAFLGALIAQKNKPCL